MYSIKILISSESEYKCPSYSAWSASKAEVMSVELGNHATVVPSASTRKFPKVGYNNRHTFSHIPEGYKSRIKLVAEVGTLLGFSLHYPSCVLVTLDTSHLVLQTPLSTPIFSVFVSKYSSSHKTSILIWLHMQRLKKKRSGLPV